MKVILYMAITPNGMIAGKDNDTSWVSKKEWKGFSGMIKKAGNMVIGRKTYDVMLESNEFEKSGLKKVKTVVVTRKKSLKAHDLRFAFTAGSPREALKVLRGEGFRTIMVCGGGKMNAGFIKEGLVDEIYLDIEPVLFGTGIPLFHGAGFQARLRLLGTKKISRDEIQLHYRVIK